MSGEKLPAPTAALGFAAAELAQHAREMEILEADPRTAGSANRPSWLVRQVLAEKADREERAAAYQARKKLCEARVLALTAFRVGDVVAVSPMWGMHVAAGLPAIVKDVRLDHDHALSHAHSDECYREDRVELVLAWGEKPDGSATLRCNEKAQRCLRVVVK